MPSIRLESACDRVELSTRIVDSVLVVLAATKGIKLISSDAPIFTAFKFRYVNLNFERTTDNKEIDQNVKLKPI